GNVGVLPTKSPELTFGIILFAIFKTSLFFIFYLNLIFLIFLFTKIKLEFVLHNIKSNLISIL
ncbi:hypothetical protein ACV3P8_17000, partial [Clostridium perfringens]